MEDLISQQNNREIWTDVGVIYVVKTGERRSLQTMRDFFTLLPNIIHLVKSGVKGVSALVDSVSTCKGTVENAKPS